MFRSSAGSPPAAGRSSAGPQGRRDVGPLVGRVVGPSPDSDSDYAPWYFRKITTAFWPPNPNPLTITVSSFAGRAIPGT